MAWQWKRIVLADGHVRYRAVNTCEQCQREFIAENPGSAKYCPECGKQIRAQQNRDRVRKHREKLKQQEAGRACT